MSTNEIRRREGVFGGGSCVIAMFIVDLFVLVNVLKLSVRNRTVQFAAPHEWRYL